MARKSRIFIAYHQNSTDTKVAEALVRHLGHLNTEVSRQNNIAPGENSSLELRRLIEASDVIVGVLSPEFLDDELCGIIERYHTRGHRIIPVVSQSCALEGSYWGPLERLPRGITSLGRKIANQQELILDTARDIAEVAKQELRPLREFLADWSMRYREIRSLSRKYQNHRPDEFLQEMERTLQSLPFLRCTLRDRHAVWEQLVEYLDLKHPDKQLKIRLEAMPEHRFRQLQVVWADRLRP